MKAKGKRQKVKSHHQITSEKQYKGQKLVTRVSGQVGVYAVYALRCLLPFAFCLLPFALSTGAQEKNDLAASDFPKLVEDYLLDLHARHPLIASMNGAHAWEGELEDYSSQAVAAEIGAVEKFQSRLAKIPPLALGFSDIFDYQILAANMKLRLLELKEVKSHERNPLLYSLPISLGLTRIATFEYAPDSSRLRHVIAKEKLIPRLLDAAADNLRHAPPVLLKVGVENLKGALKLIETDLPKTFASVKDAKLQADFKKSTRLASLAIAKTIKRLEKIEPDPDATHSFGKQNFEAWLKFSEGIDQPAEALLKVAYREMFKAQEEFRKAAAQIVPKRDPAAVWAEIRSDHPKSADLAREAQAQLDALAKFLGEKAIVTVGQEPRPLVLPAPDFLRWKGATLMTAGPLERRPFPARLFIGEASLQWNERQAEEYLAAFNRPQLWMLCIREAAGRLAQLATLKQVTSAARQNRGLASRFFTEGWAHYTEQMIVDEGFGGGDPKIRLGQLAAALLNWCRAVVAIRLHAEGMSVDQAARFFMQNAYLDETPARMEAERGALDPAYLSGAFGKLAILKIREDYRNYRKEEFSLKEFHDRLLANGMAPLWVHRRMLMPGERGRLIE